MRNDALVPLGANPFLCLVQHAFGSAKRLPSVTMLPGFLTRNECMELYARLSGRDVSNMRFYLTFAYFKLAVIIQQIYARWQRGQTQDARFALFGTRVRLLLDYAEPLTRGAAL